MHLLLLTAVLSLSINSASFRVSQHYQGQAPPAQRTESAANELTEALRLSGDVVKLFEQERYDEALPLAKRVLEIRERNLPPDDAGIATAASNLAEIYNSKKRLSEAQQFFERALRAYESKFGPDDRRVSAVLDRLGLVHFSRSQFSQAEEVWNRSLRIKENVNGAESRQVADQLHRLGEFYRYRAKYKEAEACYDRALMIMRQKLSLDSKDTSPLLEHYSCVYHETSQKEKLSDLWRKYLPEQPESDKAADSGRVLNGTALKLPKPEYPAAARDARVAGMVIVIVTIDESGKVIAARDMCGSHPTLSQVSIDAARRAEFSPTKLSGQPVKVTGQITYNFVRR